MSFTRLQELYRATAERQGLVHALEDGPTLNGDVYSVDIVPVGLPSSNALPASEDDARRLLHGLLHGLAAIHKVCAWLVKAGGRRSTGDASGCGRVRVWHACYGNPSNSV